MTATLLPNGRQQFLDGNGNPIAGGSVYFYIPTTTTFKDTWQNPEQTILNTNPVMLDASGESLIYGNGSYRQVVKDIFGNLIWDELTTAPAILTDALEIIGTFDPESIVYSAASRGILAGLDPSEHTVVQLTENPRQGIFIWNPANLSMKVAADGQQGVYVAPTFDTSGSSGAWVRYTTGMRLWAGWFGIIGDGVTTGDAAKLQSMINFAQEALPYGAFLDCGGLTILMDYGVAVTGNDIVIGGQEGTTANFHRAPSLTSGDLFQFSPSVGNFATPVARSGLQNCAVRNRVNGAIFDTNGQMTNPIGTLATAPSGVLFDTVNFGVFRNVEMANESLRTFGIVNFVPNGSKFQFNRVYEAGRIAWFIRGSLQTGSVFTSGGGVWGKEVDIECGFLGSGGTVIFSSCDEGLHVEDMDGFDLSQLHVQCATVASIVLTAPNGHKVTNIGFSELFLDSCALNGLAISTDTSGTVSKISIDGVFDSNGLDVGGHALVMSGTGAINDASIRMRRLYGWSGDAVFFNNSSVSDIAIKIDSAKNIRDVNVVNIQAGNDIMIMPGVFDGYQLGSGAKSAANGVLLGGNVVHCGVSGGKIRGFTNGVAFQAGAGFRGATGIDLRDNTTPLNNAGTNVNAKANLGAVDI